MDSTLSSTASSVVTVEEKPSLSVLTMVFIWGFFEYFSITATKIARWNYMVQNKREKAPFLKILPIKMRSFSHRQYPTIALKKSCCNPNQGPKSNSILNCGLKLSSPVSSSFRRHFWFLLEEISTKRRCANEDL